MFTQERANLVIWNLRNRAETTDTQDSIYLKLEKMQKKRVKQKIHLWSQMCIPLAK